MPLTSVLGTLTRVWYGAADLSDYLSSLDESNGVNANDVTTFAHTAVTEDPGLTAAGFKASGFLSVGVGEVHAILSAAFAGRALRPLTVSRGGDVIGAPAVVANTNWGAYNLSVAVGDAEGLDVEWGTREGIFGGYLLQNLATIAGAGTTMTTSVDYGAISTGGYAGTLHLIAAGGTGSPSLTATVQSSATQGGTYADAFTFPVVSGIVPIGLYASARGVTLQRWRRLKLVLAGTSPTYTFGVGLAGRA